MSYTVDSGLTDREWDKMTPEEKLDALYAEDPDEPWYQR